MKQLAANRNAQRYIAYLLLIGSTQARMPFSELDVPAEQLLIFLALAWSTGRKINVVQAMKESPGMSASTVHQRLKMLCARGVIALEIDEADNRFKYVVATELTQRYFAQMGQYLTQANA